MARAFLDENFLLYSDTARRLYDDYARKMPIYDFHCHLPPEQIADNTAFENMTQIWLGGDHYKWRAMRALGVPEELITGGASDRAKFDAWARAVPRTIRNPLYHWAHMELRDPFGVEHLLNETTAEATWKKCNDLLATDGFRVRAILEHFDVRVVCTTDDPTSSLEHHKAIRSDGFGVVVVPTFRPDNALKIDQPEVFRPWLAELGQAADIDVATYGDLLEALRHRHAAFHEEGCRASDHGIVVPYAEDYTNEQAAGVFAAALAGKQPNPHDIRLYRSALMHELALMNAERDWAQQFHFGALRGANSRMLAELGPDTGYDSIAEYPIAQKLARFLDRLDRTGALARTVVYTLNPAQNEVIATAIGNFQGGGVPGKMQFGSGWWFNDQKDGILRQLTALSAMGVLSVFVGMLTDSRSFLSYPRHDYFRRILCDFLGDDVERGELPREMDLIGSVVQDICYANAHAYFRIPGVRA